MAKKKISNAIKRRLLIFGTLSVLIIAYTFVNLFVYFFKYIDLYQQEKILHQQFYELKEKEENLTIELTKLRDPEYIARYARENYLYSRDGEYLIRIERKEETEEIDEKNTNYLAIAGISFSLIILSYIVIKKKKK